MRQPGLPCTSVHHSRDSTQPLQACTMLPAVSTCGNIMPWLPLPLSMHDALHAGRFPYHAGMVASFVSPRAIYSSLP
jgi:hypothetical protein